MLGLLFLLLVQQPPDPLTQRMHQFCRSRPACVAKQREGVRRFLDAMTRGSVPRAQVQLCLDRATRKKLTDWSKAAECVGTRARARR